MDDVEQRYQKYNSADFLIVITQIQQKFIETLTFSRFEIFKVTKELVSYRCPYVA